MIRIMSDLAYVVLVFIIVRMSGFHLIDLLVQSRFQRNIVVLSRIDIFIRSRICGDLDHRAAPLYGSAAASQRYCHDQK